MCVCQLRRLAGGSHKRRGREEALNNIVDILGDEVMEDVRVYQRHYGEDPSITKLYKVDNVWNLHILVMSRMFTT